MKELISKLRGRYIEILYCTAKSNDTVYKVFISEPKEHRLRELGLKKSNRGFVKKVEQAYQLHVLPCAEGWQIHIDLCLADKHVLAKKKKTHKMINDFLSEYRGYETIV